MDINEKLEVLGYNERWMKYGFLTKEELENQFQDYSKAINDPDSEEAKNGCQHTEHLRHSLFLRISENKTSFSDQELEQLIELVRYDKDSIMAESFYSYIIIKNRVTQEQINRFLELKTVSLGNI